MKGFIANTDYDWYRFLRDRPDLDEVNFWRPSGRGGFRAIPAGAPFFFKLKKPHYAVAGFGHLSYATRHQMWEAWDYFREANGVPDFESFRARIARLRRDSESEPSGMSEIVCIMLLHPVFFEEKNWIRPPTDWHSQTQQGVTYDLTTGEGRRVWQECLARAKGRRRADHTVVGDAPRYGDPVLIRPRLGQRSFRFAVADAYGRACAISLEHSLPALEAAHIKAYSEGGEHAVPNGILFRSDIHRLFDKGYVTVTPDHRFLVSRRLKDDFANGRSYYGFDQKEIRLPSRRQERPDPKILEWHNDRVFLG
jgi:putative restriction endonuclease